VSPGPYLALFVPLLSQNQNWSVYPKVTTEIIGVSGTKDSGDDLFGPYSESVGQEPSDAGKGPHKTP